MACSRPLLYSNLMFSTFRRASSALKMVRIFCPSRITGIGGEGGVSVAEPELVEPEEQLSSQPASASITADAPESLRNVRRSYRFMGVLLSIKPRTQGECARGK